MVVLTSGHTATSGMLAVLSDTTVTGADVAAFLAILFQVGSLHKEGTWVMVFGWIRGCNGDGWIERGQMERSVQVPFQMINE